MGKTNIEKIELMTNEERDKVFELRCKAKIGDKLTNKEFKFIQKMFEKYPEEYSAIWQSGRFLMQQNHLEQFNMKKEKVYVDMDGVLCNFFKAAKKALTDNPTQRYPQSQWGFFLKLEEIPGAIEGFRKLEEKYDVWILTRPSFMNVNCFTEKAQWVWDHLGLDVLKKTIMCGDKSLLKGEYLIDDMDGDGQPDFEGEWIRFKSEKFPNWEVVVEYLMNK